MRLCKFGTWISVATTMTVGSEGFVIPQSAQSMYSMQSVSLESFGIEKSYSNPRRDATKLYGKLWDKLGIPEDIVNWDEVDEEELYDDEDEDDRGPYWYVMNCVAGLELELFEQALSVQRKLPDLIQKVRVPTEKTIKSFGTKRHVVEDRVLYPGYVFLKMFLTEQTYEPLQQLPLCRSWMGTINRKGYSKLPSIPMALNPEEVTKFQGLEDDTDADEEKLLEQYGGFRVEDMIKVLKGNFANEDGVVKRLKDGQILIRLYTYGSTYDEWMPIDHIRKMTDVEAMRGLTGPSEPVTQRSMESEQRPNKFERDSSFSRRNRDSGFGGERNRRMRRNSDDSFSQQRQRKQEEENWKQYREQQREKTQQKRGDSWGLQEQSSWESKNKNTDEDFESALSGDADWIDFTSSDKKNLDIFDSIMDELGNTLEDTTTSSRDQNNMRQKDTSSSRSGSQQEDDDFFSSLMSELEGDLSSTNAAQSSSKSNAQTRQSQSTNNYDEDDFFASLETDLNDSLGREEKTMSNSNSEEDDFFASLEADLKDSLSDSSSLPNTHVQSDTATGANKNDDDDFFASLEADLNTQLSSKSHENEDFFASPSTETASPPTPELSTKDSGTSSADLKSMTVPILKEMCRERGLKVGGKKAELIERLSQ